MVGFAQTFMKIKGIILIPIFTKFLGSSAYGSWSLILATVFLIQPFITLGLSNAIVRFGSSMDIRNSSKLIMSTIFIVIFSGSIFSILIYFISDFLSLIIVGNNSLSFLFRLSSPLFLLVSLNTIIVGSFRVYKLIKRYVFVVCFQTLIEIVVVSLAIFLDFGLEGAIIILVVSNLLGFILAFYFLFSKIQLQKPNFIGFKEYLFFSIPIIPTVVFQFIVSSSDRYFIGHYLGISDVGVYSAAYGMAALLLIFSAYVVYAMRPVVYKLFENNEIDELKIFLSNSFKGVVLLTVPASLGLIAVSSPLLSLLTTPDFIGPGRFVITFVSLGIAIYSVALVISEPINFFKKTRLFLYIFSLASFINIILNIIYIPIFGLFAASLSTLISYLILASFIFIYSRRLLKFNLEIFFVLKILICSIVMGILVVLFNPSNLMELIVSVILAILVYFVLLISFRAISLKEIQMVLKIFNFKGGG